MEYKSEKKICQNCKKDFTIEPEDFNFYEKIKVPPPTFCPECRNVQRMASRNVKSLYKRSCDLCKKEVVSRFSRKNKAKMYCKDCWWGDNWDALSYGKKYDFSRTFHEQFYELLFNVPHVSLLNINMTDSEYCNMESDDKRCYLTFGGHYNEDCAFSEYGFSSKEVFDSFWSFKSEQCFDCIRVENCFRTFYSNECDSCIDTYFSFDCRNCSNIIGCATLRNKSYCIFNKQYSKEEYEKIKNNINFGSHKTILNFTKESIKIWQKTPRKNSSILHSVNCTGNYIINSKNSQNIWLAEQTEDSKNMYIVAWSKESMDDTSQGNDELCYMCSSGGGLYGSIAVLYSFSKDPAKTKHSFNCLYSHTIINCSDCFGCVGLKNKKYCILNKQYSKEEYEELCSKIKNQMKKMPFISKSTRKVFSYGDFFPDEFSLFSYNETVANDFYPKLKEEAEKEGFIWREESENGYKFSDYKIPDDIKDAEDNILEKVLKCEKTGKAYKITQQELTYYRKLNIPIPRIAPLERIKLKVQSLPPFRFFYRNCMCEKTNHNHKGKCDIEFKTPYAPDRPEIVYCESCYNKEVY